MTTLIHFLTHGDHLVYKIKKNYYDTEEWRKHWLVESEQYYYEMIAIEKTLNEIGSLPWVWSYTMYEIIVKIFCQIITINQIIFLKKKQEAGRYGLWQGQRGAEVRGMEVGEGYGAGVRVLTLLAIGFHCKSAI